MIIGTSKHDWIKEEDGVLIFQEDMHRERDGEIENYTEIVRGQ